MYFYLNYSDKSNHLERIPIAVKNSDCLLCMTSQILESDKLHHFLLSDCTRIDDNEYLESLETATEVTALAE